MTTSHVLAIIGLLVSSATALAVAFLHRKQMRQIEMYKQDPSIGLVPPSSKITSFIKSKWDDILGYGGPLIALTIELTSNSPLSRASVFLISLSVALIVLNFVGNMLFLVTGRTMSIVNGLVRSQEEQARVAKEAVQALEISAPDRQRADA